MDLRYFLRDMTVKKYMLMFSAVMMAALGLGGCVGYSNQSLYTQNVATIYVEMFQNESFRRNAEYVVTDALAKRIEVETPYKIVSSKSRADSVISGTITSMDENVLAGERETGRPLEKQFIIRAKFSWKNLKTGELIIENEVVKASGSYSEFLDQEVDYAKSLAANKIAERILEKMQLDW